MTNTWQLHFYFLKRDIRIKLQLHFYPKELQFIVFWPGRMLATSSKSRLTRQQAKFLVTSRQTLQTAASFGSASCCSIFVSAEHSSWRELKSLKTPTTSAWQRCSAWCVHCVKDFGRGELRSRTTEDLCFSSGGTGASARPHVASICEGSVLLWPRSADVRSAVGVHLWTLLIWALLGCACFLK